ncbi:MAG: isoprenylcysteine carboxylmethyltransferase family protein [Anaerolineae bacterium]|nr:isoprenylcysteine carboxylmethyltransferase family protein [Anaerolineae bacterium]
MSTELTFRLIAFLILIITFGISGYYRRKANIGGGDRIDYSEEDQRYFRLRSIGALLFYGSMLAFLIYPPLIAWAQVDLPLWLRWTALGILASMVPAFYWLFSSLGKNITPTVKIRAEHQLVIHGPYKYIRHPLYTFGFINFIAFTLLAANWFMLLTALLTFSVLLQRTPQEEAKLLERFGDQYRLYMQRTGRYLPRIG